MKEIINGIFNYSSSNFISHQRQTSFGLKKGTHHHRWVFSQKSLSLD